MPFDKQTSANVFRSFEQAQDWRAVTACGYLLSVRPWTTYDAAEAAQGASCVKYGRSVR
jgi:hypothetical protein